MRKMIVMSVVGGLAASQLLSVANAAELWRAGGFATPESAVFDEANQRIIVSNIIGEPTVVDGEGTLSVVDLEGNVVQEDWVSGLDAPKGMAIAGNSLYVADLSNVRVIDLASGAVETIAVEGATFLNDVTAAEDGRVFVTDTFANRIYSIADGAAELFVEDAALNGPNGILADGNALIVASFGVLAEKPEDMVPGGLVSVDIDSKAITPMAGTDGLGFLDGVVRVGEQLVVTDFFAGKIMTVEADGTSETLAELGMGTADLGTDGTAIYVPFMMAGELIKLSVE